MSRLGISEAFARYGATLRNPQGSVSAWLPDGSLVVSLWDHHYRKGPPGTLEFTGSLDRWSGHGNAEFRENIARAYEQASVIRLVIVKTEEIEKVEAGVDASTIKKDFFLREELTGRVIELLGEKYVFQFRKA